LKDKYNSDAAPLLTEGENLKTKLSKSKTVQEFFDGVTEVMQLL
jgi:hypothetical protein